jgi:hypothetical protein
MPILVWVLVAIVVLIALMRLWTTRPHRSDDQQILIQKSKTK